MMYRDLKDKLSRNTLQKHNYSNTFQQKQMLQIDLLCQKQKSFCDPLLSTSPPQPNVVTLAYCENTVTISLDGLQSDLLLLYPNIIFCHQTSEIL